MMIVLNLVFKLFIEKLIHSKSLIPIVMYGILFQESYSGQPFNLTIGFYRVIEQAHQSEFGYRPLCLNSSHKYYL